MFQEIYKYIKRIGPRSFMRHFFEIYIGALFRWLPGPEGLILRNLLYRTLFSHTGGTMYVYPHVYIAFCDRISTGNRLSINVGCIIDARGGLDFGDNVLIGPHCTIVTSNHVHDDLDTPICFQPLSEVRTVIGNNVWLGASSTLRPGIRIGDGSIVAAGAVVVNDVPPNSIVAGVPARVVKVRKQSAPANGTAHA